MMRKLLEIALNDLRVFFREPGQLIGVVVIPLIFTLGIGYASSGNNGPTSIRVDVVDLDGSALSSELLGDVREANSALRLCPYDNDEGDYCRLGDEPTLDEARATERVRNNETLALIVIPDGFEERVTKGEAVSVGYLSNENATAPSYILQALQTATGRMASAQVAAVVSGAIVDAYGALTFTDAAARDGFQAGVYENAAAVVSTNPITVDFTLTEQTGGDSNSGTQSGFGQSIPGMGSMFVMFTVFASLFVLIREKRNWTIQRMVMMPLTRGQILGGKILMWFLVGMLQFAVVFVIGLVVGVNFGHDVVALLLVMMLYTLCITAFSFAISTLLKTEAQANSVSLLLALMLASLGGAWWPLDVVPGFMQVIGHLSPVAWAMDGFRSLIFENGTLMTVLPSLGVLGLLTAIFFGFAVWRFRYE